MNEVDKRIAVEVMGEVQPEWRYPVGKPPPPCVPETSQGGAWWRGSWNHDWQPLPFSSDLDQAMRAVDKYFAEIPDDVIRLHLEYDFSGDNDAWMAWTERRGVSCGYGWRAPEAICNRLLALVEDDYRS